MPNNLGLRCIPLTASQRQQFRAARLAIGWSQGVLAERMRVSTLHINRLELGRSSPSVEFMEQWCQKLGIRWQVAICVTTMGRAPGETDEDTRDGAWAAGSGDLTGHEVLNVEPRADKKWWRKPKPVKSGG